MSRNYKFHNLVEEGLVYKPEDYVYNSARDYSGEKRYFKRCYCR